MSHHFSRLRCPELMSLISSWSRTTVSCCKPPFSRLLNLFFISSATVGIALRALLIIIQADLFNRCIRFKWVFLSKNSYKTRHPYVKVGLTTIVWIQLVILGSRPHFLPNTLYKGQRKPFSSINDVLFPSENKSKILSLWVSVLPRLVSEDEKVVACIF